MIEGLPGRSTRGIAPERYGDWHVQDVSSLPARPGGPTSTPSSPGLASTPPGLATPARPVRLAFIPQAVSSDLPPDVSDNVGMESVRDIPDLAYSDHSDDDSDDSDYEESPVIVTGRTIRRPSRPASHLRPGTLVSGDGRRATPPSTRRPLVRPPGGTSLPATSPPGPATSGPSVRPPAGTGLPATQTPGPPTLVPATPAPAVRRDVREVAGVGVDQVNLDEWLYPMVPSAHPGTVADDADGWNMIDKWHVWDCALAEFPTMQDIPRAYREIWATGVAKVLRVIQAADEGFELERGLKWFLILPKAVFRQARRGGKAGRGQITRRVNCLVRGDWGGLLSLLERDCQLARREERRARRANNEATDLENKRRNTLMLLLCRYLWLLQLCHQDPAECGGFWLLQLCHQDPTIKAPAVSSSYLCQQGLWDYKEQSRQLSDSLKNRASRSTSVMSE